MNLNQDTLVLFEAERKANEYVPPAESNSFYTIGDGQIMLYTVRDDDSDYRFDIYTNSGTVHVGEGEFAIAGDIVSTYLPYRDMTVITGTELVIDDTLKVSKGTMTVYGTVEIPEDGRLTLLNGGSVTFALESELTLEEGGRITINSGCSLTIYGTINIPLSYVDTFMEIDGLTIDSAAVMNVTGMDSMGSRIYSLTDYYTDLSNQVIKSNTQGEKNFTTGRIGYKWTDGNSLHQSQSIQISTLYGESILGDFKLSILGYTSTEITNYQLITNLIIESDTTLYVADDFYGYSYVNPELYIGRIVGNCKTTGLVEVYGTLIVSGSSSMITLDRGGQLIIEEGAEVYLQNGSIMRSTYNEDAVLYINGTLTIDTIDQIDTFVYDNIVFGDNGKLAILNPDTGAKQLLWTTPNGIKESKLYELFEDRIEKVEYHINANNGIGVDEYYEYYNREFTDWYGGRRIEQAIHEGLLVWHDGGFIELYSDVTPWVNKNCTLLQASRIFKTFGTYDYQKLQELVNHLQYAGSGNILFRFIDGNDVAEVTLVLDAIHMTNIYNHPLTGTYVLSTDNSGELFLKNNLSTVTPENIIVKEATVISVEDTEASFPL